MSTVTAVPLLPVKKAYVRWIWLGAVLALIAAALLAMQAPVDPSAAFLTRNAKQAGVVTTASGLQYKVLEKGKGGATPTDADVVLVEYEGRFLDGKVFDKSQQPTPFPLGGGAIKGFEEGLKLMPKGSKYRLWIKPSLGYGDQPVPPTGETVIPAHSLLVFDVTLVDFQSKQLIQQMQMMQQMQQGGGAAPGGAPAGAPPAGAR